MMTPRTSERVWEAGRALDRAVAERVFGKSCREVFRDRDTGLDVMQWPPGVLIGGEWVPPYSTDIAAAWAIIEHARGWIFSKRQRFFAALRITLQLRPNGELPAWPAALILFGHGNFPTFPLAICRAALGAVEG